MELFEFFYTLTDAMYQSFWQAIVIYIMVKFILLIFSNLTSSSRYTILYTAQCIIFYFFLSSFYQAGELAKLTVTAENSGFSMLSPASMRFSIKTFIMSNAALIGSLYITGVLAQCLFLLAGFSRLWKIKKRAEMLSESWYQKLDELKTKLNISNKIEIYTGKNTWVPFTSGFIKPVIYFPFTAFVNLSPVQVEAILLHELAHIKRNDYLFNLIQKAIEMIMFFNPVSWALGADIRKEREFCCDDMVLKHIPDSQIYAEALYILEKTRAEQIQLGMASTGFKKHSLIDRIKRLTDMNTYRSNLKPAFLSLASVVAVGLSLAFVSPSLDSLKHKKPAKSKQVQTPAAPPFFTASALQAPPLVPAKVPTVPLAEPIPEEIPVLTPVDTVKLKSNSKMPELRKQMEELRKHNEEMKRQSAEMKKQFNSSEWRKKQEMLSKNAEEIHKQFQSPEWKRQQQLLEKNAEEIAHHFNSPEWKKQQKDIENQAFAMDQKFNSPEWKNKLRELEKQSEEMEKKFNSPEWKNKMKEMEKRGEEMEKKFNSPEWKRKMEQLEKEAEKREHQ